MEEEIVRNLNYDKLRTCINKMSVVANKICYAIDEMEPSFDRLILSRQLDELMIEYLDIINIEI